jgi:hypothetical protein
MGGRSVRTRDALADMRGGSRGANVARVHDRSPFRTRGKGRDAARVGGLITRCSAWPSTQAVNGHFGFHGISRQCSLRFRQGG